MLEWLKRHAWKACIRQKRIPGSNPGHSAKNVDYQCLRHLIINVFSCSADPQPLKKARQYFKVLLSDS